MKKILSLTFCLLFSLSSMAQFQVVGKMRLLKPITLKVQTLDSKVVVECELKSDKSFKTKKVNIAPDLYRVTMGEYSQMCLLDNNTMTLKGFLNDKSIKTSNLIVEGTALNSSYNKLSKQYWDGKFYKSGEKTQQFIDANKGVDPLVFAAILHDHLPTLRDFETFNNVLKLQGDDPMVQVVAFVRDEAAKRQNVRLGMDVKDFTARDKDGNSVSLSDFKGKIVLLDFWASWCGPCRAEMKKLKPIYSEIKGDDLVFISISLDDSGDKWIKASGEEQLEWVSLWDKAGFKNSQFKEQLGFNSIPFIVLIDKQGKLVAQQLRGDKVKEEILKLRSK